MMKYIHARTPNEETPPYALIPSYMTVFQSSPVRIYEKLQNHYLCSLHHRNAPETQSASFARNYQSSTSVYLPSLWNWISRQTPAFPKARRSQWTETAVTKARRLIVWNSTTTLLSLIKIASIWKKCNVTLIILDGCLVGVYYLVTLKTRNNLTQRNTEIPSGGITLLRVSIVSVMLPITTKQSKRLNRDTK